MRSWPARPAPRPALANDCVAPRDAREATLGKVWEAVLGVAPIGVDDDFFDLGGDSLRAFALEYALHEGVIEVEEPDGLE